jgi:hypothetical protein
MIKNLSLLQGIYLDRESSGDVQRSEVLQGSVTSSETGFGDGVKYLRNGATEPLKKGGRFPSLSTTLRGPCPSPGALSIRLIFCHSSMRTRAEGTGHEDLTHTGLPFPLITPRQSPERQNQKRSLQISAVVFFSPLAFSKN